MQHLKIGVTERGDAALDFSWYDKCMAAAQGKRGLNGALVITKNLSEKVQEKLLDLHAQGFPIIVHATCTGWGKDPTMEPGVPACETQIQQLADLIKKGFPADHTVLRVDPVFPSDAGLDRFKKVLDLHQATFPNVRVRMSVYDEYPHVRDRLLSRNLRPLYNGRFYSPTTMMARVLKVMQDYPQITFETCAEPYLNGPNILHLGCLSNKDLAIMGLPEWKGTLNGQNRSGCLCCACKAELLTGPKKPCGHGCIYCFWRTPEEDDKRCLCNV